MAQMSPFDIFGIEPKFRIDKEKLEAKYVEIQKKVHPDRFASATETEKRVAQQWATLINDAYQKLTDPVQRGMLLCAMRGCPIDEDSSGNISADFLMDQLERREAIAEAKSEGANDELLTLKKAIEKERADLLEEVGRALDEKSDATLAAEDLKKVMFLNRQLQDFE